MRRVDRLHFCAFAFELTCSETCMGATLGAVTVNYVNPKLGGETSNLGGGSQVAEAEPPAHGNSRQAQRAVVGEPSECGRVALDPGIADHPDLGPELGLADCKVVDMTKQAADGRVQAMQNAKRGAHRARIERERLW